MSEAEAKAKITAFLTEKTGARNVEFCMEFQAGGFGSDGTWAFWVLYHDDNGYLRSDGSFEFYGTCWDPDLLCAEHECRQSINPSELEDATPTGRCFCCDEKLSVSGKDLNDASD